MFTKNGMLAEIKPGQPERIIVFGDIHGDLEVLQAGLEIATNNDFVIFLGDFADRGPEGVEVIDTVNRYITENAVRSIGIKGNHEDYTDFGEPKFSPCTLIREAEQKTGGWNGYFEKFQEFAGKLYMAAILPGRALFVHGGISSAIKSKDDLADPDEQLIQDILWSDPGEGPGEGLNFRGAGKVFGEDISGQVTSALDVKHIIRSHEPRKASFGPAFEHDMRVITVNSTGVYGGKPFVLVLEMENFPETREDFEAAVRWL
jgi:hypothetical protein